ncbi:MAG: chain-length determining protein, partial [Bacteroidaceae bacterium]|nr:chain-length determining protein [Bacteroidaceae bacterium]
ADSVRARLQLFITDYRTSKARIDKEYYERLTVEAKAAYEEATARYGRYCDTHRDIILQSMMSDRDALENDMQMKYQTYQAMSTQLEAAKAKVQERTPAFTILQGASVPVKPQHPKRMIFILGMLILSTFGATLYVLRDELKKTIN